MYTAYGQDTLWEEIAQRCLYRFRFGNFDVKDNSRSDCQTVLTYLGLAGHKRKLDIWVSLKFTQKS